MTGIVRPRARSNVLHRAPATQHHTGVNRERAGVCVGVCHQNGHLGWPCFNLLLRLPGVPRAGLLIVRRRLEIVSSRWPFPFATGPATTATKDVRVAVGWSGSTG